MLKNEKIIVRIVFTKQCCEVGPELFWNGSDSCSDHMMKSTTFCSKLYENFLKIFCLKLWTNKSLHRADGVQRKSKRSGHTAPFSVHSICTINKKGLTTVFNNKKNTESLLSYLAVCVLCGQLKRGEPELYLTHDDALHLSQTPCVCIRTYKGTLISADVCTQHTHTSLHSFCVLHT